MSSTAISSKRVFWISWIAFLATFPAGMLAGRLLARGQDVAGSGIGMGLGMLGVGLLGGIVTAIFVSYSTVRTESRGEVIGQLAVVHPRKLLVDGVVHADW